MKKIFLELAKEEIDFVLDCIKNKKELDKNATDNYGVELYYRNNLPTFLQVNSTGDIASMSLKINYNEDIKNIDDWWIDDEEGYGITWSFSKRIVFSLFKNPIIYFKLVKIYNHYKKEFNKRRKEKRKTDKLIEELDLMNKLPESVKNRLKMKLI